MKEEIKISVLHMFEKEERGSQEIQFYKLRASLNFELLGRHLFVEANCSPLSSFFIYFACNLLLMAFVWSLYFIFVFRPPPPLRRMG